MKNPEPRPAESLYLRLEVRPGASRREIVSAYRRLVHGAHPDARPGIPRRPSAFARSPRPMTSCLILSGVPRMTGRALGRG
jgi:hypothetical protein